MGNKTEYKKKNTVSLHKCKNYFFSLFWFRLLQPATKAPRGRPSPRRGAEGNGKKEAETGGSG